MCMLGYTNTIHACTNIYNLTWLSAVQCAIGYDILNIYTHIYECNTHIFIYTCLMHVNHNTPAPYLYIYTYIHMGWLLLVGSLKL